MHIPSPCKNFIQVLPEDAVIQGFSQITALVRVNAENGLPKNSSDFIWPEFSKNSNETTLILDSPYPYP